MPDERRRWRRQSYVGGCLPPAARVRPGAPVTLVNLSRGGALVESGLRLPWGTRCELEWISGDGRVAVAGRVLRCFVARLEASAVRYRTALRFEAPAVDPPEQDLLAEYQLPGAFGSPPGGGVVGARRNRPRGPGTGKDRGGTREGEGDAVWHRP